MKVEDIMTKDFVSIQADDTLGNIIKTLAKNKITCAPVIDEGEFVGLISDSQLVKYFSPKRYGLLWKKEKESPMGEITKITARQIAKKPSVALEPTKQLSQVLELVAQKTDYIPVVEKGHLVGLIRGEDIIAFFLKEIAKHDYKESAGVIDEDKRLTMDTELDGIVTLVKKRGKILARDVGKELGISQNAVEKLAEILHRHHLVRINYSFLNGVELESV